MPLPQATLSPNLATGAAAGYSDPDAPLFILEYHQDNVIVSAIVLPNVSSYRVHRSPASSLEYTLSGDVYRTYSDFRRQVITFQGRSGTSHRLGHDRTGSILFATGDTLFRELEEFIKAYVRGSTAEANERPPGVKVKNSNRLGGNRLILRAFFEKHNFFVEPVALTVDRNAMASRFGYEWSLQLVAYMDAKKPKMNLLGQIKTAMKRFQGYINIASAYTAYAASLVESTTSTIDHATRGTLQALGRVLDEATNVFDQFGVLTRDIPQLIAKETIALAAKSVKLLDAAARSFRIGSDDRKVLRDALMNIGEVRRSTMEVIGGNGGVGASGLDFDTESASSATNPTTPPGSFKTVRGGLDSDGKWFPSDFGSASFFGPGTVFGIYSAFAGDDFIIIAEKLGISVEALMALNGTSNPTELASGASIYPGAPIKVPVGTGSPADVIGHDGSAYGVDFLLGADGDLVGVGTSPTDFATITGLPLLKQALLNRLTTQRGESIFPNYGLPAKIGESGLLSTSGMIAAHTREQIIADWRVDDVKELDMVDVGDGLAVECLAVTKIGAEVSMLVPQV